MATVRRNVFRSALCIIVLSKQYREAQEAYIL